MKLLAFNASPRKVDGTTEVLIDKFVEGAREAGAEIDEYYVVDLKINGCLGCFGCWWKTPGEMCPKRRHGLDPAAHLGFRRAAARNAHLRS